MRRARIEVERVFGAAVEKLGLGIEWDRFGGWLRSRTEKLRGVRLVAGGTTWSGDAAAIDASGTSLAGRRAAFRLARYVADGWRSIIVAVGGETSQFAIFANGRMISTFTQK